MMNKNKNLEIRKTLDNSFQFHYNIVQSFTLEKFAREYIKSYDVFYKSIGMNNYKSDAEATDLIKLVKEDAIVESILSIKNFQIDEFKVVSHFINEINKSLTNYNNLINNFESDKIFQSIFIEDDHFPFGFLSLYGKGDFNISIEPRYLNFDYNNQLFDENSKIDFSPIFDKRIQFEEFIEDSGFDFYLLESDFFDSLCKMYRYKAYFLLNKAFSEIDIKKLSNAIIEKPFYVFANEHDCEVSNIYVYD